MANKSAAGWRIRRTESMSRALECQESVASLRATAEALGFIPRFPLFARSFFCVASFRRDKGDASLSAVRREADGYHPPAEA